MKRIFLFVLLVVLIPSSANAGKFAGLKPGESTKMDADAKLGQPIREVVEGRRYDYNPEKHEARRLSLEFKGGKQIIKTINIHFVKRHERDKVKGWFDLKSPAKKEIDDDGNLVEYYMPKAIAFHYDGPENTSPIKYLTHFDKDMLGGVSDYSGEGTYFGIGERAFLGVEVTAQRDGVKVVSVLRGSPAEKAGLKKGDIIKRVENYDLENGGMDSEDFSEIISDMPVEKPLLFAIERGKLALDINIALESIDEEELQAIALENKEKAKEVYQKALEARNNGQWMKSINYIKQAIQFDSSEGQYAEALAWLYYRIGEDEKAVEAMERSVELSPDYEMHLRMGRIYLDLKRYDEALDAFKKAERLRPEDINPGEICSWLGAAYFHMDDVDEAVGYSLRAYKLSRKRSALAAFYLGACFDEKKNTKDAMYYYKRFLKLKPEDEKREVLARTRLKEMRNDPEYRQKKEETRQRWMSVFGAMAGEMSGEGGGYRNGTSTSYPPSSGSQESSTDWDAVFQEGSQQQDTSQYDDVFTMPPRY